MKLSSYIPINTEGKIDKILQDLSKQQFLSQRELQQIELEILLLIKKLKIQLYFKSEFSKFKSNIRRRTGLISNSGQQRNKKYKYQLTYEMVENRSINLISEIIGQKPSTLLSILQKHNSNLSLDDTLDIQLWKKSSDFLCNSYDLNLRYVTPKKYAGISKIEGKTKFKPSLGIPGNYSKLIYIRTKS